MQQQWAGQSRQPPTTPLLGRRPSSGSHGPAFAAVDLGTNNCRLLIGTPRRGGFRIVDSYSRLTRLGEGLHRDGRLGQPAMARAMQALQACADRIDRVELHGLRVVATEACRRASNGTDFVAAARAATGLPISVISTREEAELAAESCAPLLLRRERQESRAVIFDIGGGSTEIAWVRVPGTDAANGSRGPGAIGPRVIGSTSIPLGVVTLAEAAGGAFDSIAYDRIVTQVIDALAAFERTHCIRREIARGPVRMLGTSGTLTTLAAVALGLPRYRRDRVDGLELDADEVRAVTRHLRDLGPAALGQHGAIGESRAPFVLPGCAIVEALGELWPTGRVTVTDRGLRDGMLLRMMRDAASLPVGARTTR